MFVKSVSLGLLWLAGSLLLRTPALATQCLSGQTGIAVPSPTWTSLDVSGNTGLYYEYYDNNASPEVSGQTLSDYSNTFTIPGASGGTFPTGEGTWSTLSYPAGTSNSPTAWPVNNIQGTTSCVPGITCQLCEVASSNSYDCYNRTIAKGVAIGMRSSSFASSNGFRFDGSFNGSASSPAGGEPIYDVAFWHQSPIYLGGPEYGIAYDTSQNLLYFYWDTDSNCSLYGGVCSGSEGGITAPTLLDTMDFGYCTLTNVHPSYSDTYLVYIVDNGGTYDFYLNVTDSLGLEDGDGPWLMDPSVTGFSISAVQNAAGYVSVGVNRIDPNCYGAMPTCGTYTSVPYLYASYVQVGS